MRNMLLRQTPVPGLVGVLTIVALSVLFVASALAAGLPPNLLGGGQLRAGTGSRVLPFTVRKAGPVALLLGASGDSNVIATITGPSGKEFLVNAIGTYSGMTLYPYAKPGRYRLAIEAPSSWKASLMSFSTQYAGGGLIGTFRERGDYVIMGTLKLAAEPIVTASCTCDGNFVVYIRDFKGGSDLLVNEIGRYKGQVIGPSMAAGYYLLDVQADGPWVVKLAR